MTNKITPSERFALVANRRPYFPTIRLRAFPTWARGVAVTTERGEPLRSREILRAAARSAVSA